MRSLRDYRVLLAPGAGAGSDQPALVAVDAALSGAGAAVRRMDFPYRLAGRRAPDREPVLLEAVRKELQITGASRDHVIVGGRSMGGRMCSMVAAEEPPVAGVVLISYPLHPPGRPERLRTAHFEALDVPCLFVSGTRDAFGTVEELERAVGAIPGPVRVVWLDGKDHSLRRADEVVAAAVVEWATDSFGAPR